MIGLIANILKTIEQQQAALAPDHADQERWGIVWLPTGTGVRMKKAGAKEYYPPELPFVLIDGSTLPTKGTPTSPTRWPPRRPRTWARSCSPPWTSTKAERPPPPAAPPSPRPRAPRGPRPRPPPARPPERRPTPPSPRRPPAAPPRRPRPRPRSSSRPRRLRPTAPAPAVTTARGAAFAVAPGLLVTCERLVAGATNIVVTDVDGDPLPAEVLSSDPQTGLALLKVDKGDFKPLPLATACRAGATGVACFSRAGVFQPEMDVLRGDVSGGAGKFTMKMAIHPRTAGSPCVDEQGRVIAVVSATRDDPMDHLPVIPVEWVRKLLGKQAALATGGARRPLSASSKSR